MTGRVRTARDVSPASLLLVACLMLPFGAVLGATDLDEFKVKREAVFEFAQKPIVTRAGDRVTITFETKAFCDVTVAIEDEKGRIVRHLACGVLGPNAPEPFQKGTKKQTLIWDGKNDKGEYIDDKDAITVRVSLGLRARYEKSLFWEPKKRVSRGGAGGICTEDVLPVPTPEGVYVFDGNGVDHVRLFDHDGDYVRTVYPFPAAKLKDVKGLTWRDYPQGYARPAKHGLNQTTFLTSGTETTKRFREAAASTMAVWTSPEEGQPGRIALAKASLNRLSTDGGVPHSLSDHATVLPLDGPRTYENMIPGKKWDGNLHKDSRMCPYSSAFSPDGKRLYLAGFNGFNTVGNFSNRRLKAWLDGVTYLDYEADAEPKIFIGGLKRDAGIYAGLVCDSAGRVYVSNYIDNAIEVYTPDAKLVKTIPIERPTSLAIDPKTSELYVFSWYLGGPIWEQHPKLKPLQGNPMPPATLTILKSVDDPDRVARFSLPYVRTGQWGLALTTSWGETRHGTHVRAAVDFWADKPTIWLVPDGGMNTRGDFAFGTFWERSGILLLQAHDGELKIKRDFGKETVRSVTRQRSNVGHQRLYVNPADGMLYVTENEHWVGGGSFHNLLQINPDTGRVKEVPIPLQWAEDMTFDIDGRVYLRQVEPRHRVVRYDAATWREIPWDYGEAGQDKDGSIIAGLPLPSIASGCYSQGGISISPTGHLVVSCAAQGRSLTESQQARMKEVVMSGGRETYKPRLYPGRRVLACIHVWDDRGRVIYEDAVPGVSATDGLAIDRHDNIYLLSWAPRVHDGKPYFNRITGTLMKVAPGKSKWLARTGAPVPLSEGERPERSLDISGYTTGDVWIEGADWFYGGVGNCSFKIATGCICWQQSRFTLDYFARPFAPEMDQFSVAVLDTNGNLITRIGQYGNVDDGMPLSKDPRLTPPHPRSIGGDEVSLMHASHVATLTDRHLYIGDIGNARIVSVKLGYHAEERIQLKDVPQRP